MAHELPPLPYDYTALEPFTRVIEGDHVVVGIADRPQQGPPSGLRRLERSRGAADVIDDAEASAVLGGEREALAAVEDPLARPGLVEVDRLAVGAEGHAALVLGGSLEAVRPAGAERRCLVVAPRRRVEALPDQRNAPGERDVSCLSTT